MTEPAAPSPPRKRRRWWLLLLLPPALLGAGWLYLSLAAQWRLARAVAEAERTDPHWRLDDMLTDRVAIPDDQNSALTIQSVNAKLPPKWSIEPPRLPKNGYPQLNQAWPAQYFSSICAQLERVATARQEARRIADQPRGRFPNPYTKDYGTTLHYTCWEDMRRVASLLRWDAECRAEEGDLDGALASCCAVLNCERAVFDEPNLNTQLLRGASDVASFLERVLGQGEASDAALAPLQHLLEEEADGSPFRLGVRSLRAEQDRLMESLQRGETTLTKLHGGQGSSWRDKRWFGEPYLLHSPGAVTDSRAALLERMNRYVEISRLSPEQQVPLFTQMKASLADGPLLVRQLDFGMAECADQARRRQARSLCAAVALAVERYRRKHGRWPDGLADLTDDFLREVPADPLDGRPLRYHKSGEGVVVYSVGPDGKGDSVYRTALKPTNGPDDYGFRLWNVDQRHRPPPADPSPAPEPRR